VNHAIQELGRTEDVKFSPDSRRLAVLGYYRDKIVVFDVEIDASRSRTKVHLTGSQEITSSSLRRPHGLSFVDDETLVVANLNGEVPILKLPPAGSPGGKWELSAVHSLGDDGASLLRVPSSVAVMPLDDQHCDVLICNNKTHSVTRHTLEHGGEFVTKGSEVLLRRGLNIPDGVAINCDRSWIAVSNHADHNVYLYRNVSGLNPDSKPDGILQNVNFPHGVRFTPDDNFVLVADAGSPFVNVYAKNGGSWKGSRNPISSFRVMDEDAYLRGRTNPQEGGPKGLDVDCDMNVMVTTSVEQRLAFFDLPAMLKQRSVPLEWRKRSLNWRLERMQEKVQPVRNNLALRTRLRRLCGIK